MWCSYSCPSVHMHRLEMQDSQIDRFGSALLPTIMFSNGYKLFNFLGFSSIDEFFCCDLLFLQLKKLGSFACHSKPPLIFREVTLARQLFHP